MEKDEYIIVSVKHTDLDSFPLCMTMWGPDYRGYTVDLEEAGKYSRKELEEKYGNCKDYQFVDKKLFGFVENGPNNLFVKVSDIENVGFKKKTVLIF